MSKIYLKDLEQGKIYLVKDKEGVIRKVEIIENTKTSVKIKFENGCTNWLEKSKSISFFWDILECLN